MPENFDHEPLLDMYIFETNELMEQLEQIVIDNEKYGCFTEDAVNEIFRIMHTIKGSSAMMMYDNIAKVAHSMEDLFFFIRENDSKDIDCSKLSDIVLNGIDFIKSEVDKIVKKENPDGDASSLISDANIFLSDLKGNSHNNLNAYRTTIHFEEDCEMENIRAFSIIENLKEFSKEIHHVPEELFENEDSIDYIRKNGFKIFFKTDKDYDEMHKLLMQTALLKEMELLKLEDVEELNELSNKDEISLDRNSSEILDVQKNSHASANHQNIISVNVDKLDKLMDIVGELVISESMVIQNPDLKGLELTNFHKAARQLQKNTDELQDIVMSIRMVPLAATFKRMNRIVRDMSKKLSKKINLKIIGEDTEVDKNIIEHISDPLIHLVRNAIDHGIESPEDRISKGKPETGTITLEAKNEGGDVLIIIKDDGKGLNREKILTKAIENGLVNRPKDEITDKEVFSYIFLPGFSTNSDVTEYSGRGVGMDVVTNNIKAIGGNVSIDSITDNGTTIALKIPLTLAIMDGMTIKVGKSIYTLPIISIKESFRPKKTDIITDPDGNEMILIRGECYPILRLHELYKVKTEITNITNGIMIMVHNDNKNLCIFADGLVGEQQVVVKALPEYIKKFNNTSGLSGCTLLGDGSISLILDVAGLINN